MANLYANVAQLSRDEDIAKVFDMVTADAARQLGVAYGLTEGAPATIVLLEANGARAAMREIARVLTGWKDGLKSFDNGRTQIFRRSPG
jgi:cytosine deaminase